MAGADPSDRGGHARAATCYLLPNPPTSGVDPVHRAGWYFRHHQEDFVMRSGPRRTLSILPALVLGALLLTPAPGRSDEPKPWGPYLKDKKGESKPLPDKPEKMKDDDWRKIAYTDFEGLRPRVAVYLPPVRDDQVSSKDMNSDVGKALVLFYSKRTPKQPDGTENPEIQLRQALSATNRFRMVEGSSSVDNLLNEQDFGASGRVSGASAAQLKRITGAQYITRVTILEINPEKESKSIAVGAGALTGNVLGLGSIGISGKVAYCCLNAKIVNVESGDIVSDITATGTSKGHGVGFGAGMLKGISGGLVGAGGLINTETAASLGEAIQAAVNKVAYLTANKFEDLPLTMNVIDADDRTVTVEGGKDLGLQQGMLLHLESNLGPLTNAKGDTLDWKRADNGQAKVVRVLPTVAMCEYVSGGKGTK